MYVYDYMDTFNIENTNLMFSFDKCFSSQIL